MTTRVITLEEDPVTGDLILPLDDGIFEECGWKIGDTIQWIDNGNGSWTLRKEENA
jgi:hypothetical protein